MALQPIPNYSINVPDAGAAFEQGIQMRQQYEARQLQQQEAENIKRDIAALGARPTVAAITDLITKYPQLSERFKAKLGQLSDEERQNRLAIATPIYAAMQNGNTDVAKTLLKQQADARRNSGDEKGARDAEAQIKLIELDPNAATTSFGVTLAGIMGPEPFKSTFGELREQQLQPQKVADAKAKAAALAKNAGIEPFQVKYWGNGVTMVIGKNNEQMVRDATGRVLTGADAAAAVESGKNYEIELAGGKARATATATAAVEATTRPGIERSVEEAKQAVAVAKEASAGLAKVTTSLANLRRALELSNGGANTGVIARAFPTIKAASVELDNLRNNLGLDVVAGGNFGALSESELRLALDTGLPTGLDEAELAEWLERKIAAQESVRQAFAAKARHFARGGTTAEWLDKFESGAATAPAAPRPAGAGQQPVVSVDY